MKSFLLRNGSPTVKWGSIPSHCFFEGNIPEGYDLAVAPTDDYIVVDVDKKNDKNGFHNIPTDIFLLLTETYYYNTKSGGAHFWLKYTGTGLLKNTSTKYGIDLRIGAKDGNCGGYVKYHPASNGEDIRDHVKEIKETSLIMNLWLEKLFS
jgi:hypothetical protein